MFFKILKSDKEGTPNNHQYVSMTKCLDRKPVTYQEYICSKRKNDTHRQTFGTQGVWNQWLKSKISLDRTLFGVL